MDLYKYFIGLLKVGSDLFALPDLYTYLLGRYKMKNRYFLLPYSFFIDIVLNFPLGSFFLVDILAYRLFKKLKNWVVGAEQIILLYFIRYFLLYCLGLSTFYILEQMLYALFFMFMFRIVRG